MWHSTWLKAHTNHTGNRTTNPYTSTTYLTTHPLSLTNYPNPLTNASTNCHVTNKHLTLHSNCMYNDALRQSNFDATLTYEQPTSDEYNSDSNRTQRRNKQRNTIWYNPPYSKNVKKTSDNGSFNWLIKIFHLLINWTKFSTDTTCKLQLPSQLLIQFPSIARVDRVCLLSLLIMVCMQ